MCVRASERASERACGERVCMCVSVCARVCVFRCDSVRCSCPTEVLRLLQRSAKEREGGTDRGGEEGDADRRSLYSFAADLRAGMDRRDGAYSRVAAARIEGLAYNLHPLQLLKRF